MYLFNKRNLKKPVNVKIMYIINAIAIAIFVVGVTWKLINLIF